jgi:hypothetical protein
MTEERGNSWELQQHHNADEFDATTCSWEMLDPSIIHNSKGKARTPTNLLVFRVKRQHPLSLGETRHIQLPVWKHSDTCGLYRRLRQLRTVALTSTGHLLPKSCSVEDNTMSVLHFCDTTWSFQSRTAQRNNTSPRT